MSDTHSAPFPQRWLFDPGPYSTGCWRVPVQQVRPVAAQPSLPRLPPLLHRTMPRSLRFRPVGDRPAHRRAQRLARPCLSRRHLLIYREHGDASATDRATDGIFPRGGYVMTPPAGHMSAFLRDHLRRDKNASLHTIDAYSQGLSPLIRFAADRDTSDGTSRYPANARGEGSSLRPSSRRATAGSSSPGPA